MKTNVSYKDLVNQLVVVFDDPAKLCDYHVNRGGGALREGLCGWAGAMSPLNRIAFADDFGEDVLQQAEREAREILDEKEKAYQQTHHADHVREADNNRKNADFVPSAGCFCWAATSGLKQGGNAAGEVEQLLYDEKTNHLQLVKIEKVYNVSEDDFNRPYFADELVKREKESTGIFAGGIDSDDLERFENEFCPTDEELKVCYTVAAAVVDPVGRWFLIDSEGYDYARYILLPESWRNMYAETVTAYNEKKQREEREEKEREDNEKKQRQQEYKNRCEKWAYLMQDVRPIEAALNEEFAKSGYRSSAEAKRLERKLHNLSRANILAMCRAAFPDIKFSLRCDRGWGDDWILSYTDGPTEQEFTAATDLRLFAAGGYHLDAYSDYLDFETDEMTDFAVAYMEGGLRHGISVNREESEESRAMISEKIRCAAPELVDNSNIQAEDLQQYYSAFSEQFGEDITRKVLHKDTCNMYFIDVALLQHVFFNNISFCAILPEGPKGGKKVDHCEAVQQEPREVTPAEATAVAAPASLVLVDYSEKAVAVFGDTAQYKDELKKLGGRFNPRLKQDGSTRAGWIFSKKNAGKVADFISATAPAPAVTAEPTAEPIAEPIAESTAEPDAATAPAVTAEPTAEPIAAPDAAPAPAVSASSFHAADVAHIAPVIPASTIADATGSPAEAIRTYAVCEKSPISRAAGLLECDEIGHFSDGLRWMYYTACLPYSVEEIRDLDTIFRPCFSFIAYFDERCEDPREDATAAKVLEIFAKLYEIGEVYNSEAFPDFDNIEPSHRADVLQLQQQAKPRAVEKQRSYWEELNEMVSSEIARLIRLWAA